MPADDVSDLRDVVDAINRLCETMKTSDYVNDDGGVREDAELDVEVGAVELVSPEHIVVNEVETYVDEMWREASVRVEAAAPARVDSVSTVALDLTPTRTEKVAHVATHRSHTRVEDVESIPTRIEFGNVDTVVLESFVSQTEIAAFAASNKVVTQLENTELAASNQFVAHVGNTELVASNQFVAHVENTELVASNQFVAHVENTELVASNQFAAQPETAQPVPSNQTATRFESLVSATSDTEQVMASFEPTSEMYYTASSEASLLSDTEVPYTAPSLLSELEVPYRARAESPEGQVPRDDRNGVMAGHVAAMRERFENMTRTNTPCPDLMRSVSPSLDLYRNVTPSPDHLG